jgi:two-component system NtrC family sensor kinase
MKRPSTPRKRAPKAAGRKASKAKPNKAVRRKQGSASSLRVQLKRRTAELAQARAQAFANQAAIAIESARLFEEVQEKTRDLHEVQSSQTGSAKILKIIASSPTDVGLVLNAIVESACELCDASDAVLRLKDGEDLCVNAHHGPIPTVIQRWPINPNWTAGRSVLDRKPIHVCDMLSPEGDEFFEGRRPGATHGLRSILSVPLLREGEPMGAITLRRTEVHPFSEKQVNLLQTFADQAVIALQNARHFQETREALERQTATAEILKVIASSPSDVRPVFEAIAARAKSLVDGFSSTVFRFIDGMAHLEAFTPTTPKADAILTSTFPRPASEFAPFRMTQAGEVMQIPETEALTDDILEISRARGFRSMVFAPLMNKGLSIGFIAVTRIQPGNFTDHHVQSLRTFADQAVIAIQNVGLFDEVQAKTRDLEEALRNQTGSANILNVIASSPTDVTPVLNAIVRSACALCGADDALVRLRRGHDLEFSAHHGPIPVTKESLPISRDSTAGLAVIERTVVHAHDLLTNEGHAFPQTQQLARRFGLRTILSIPLIRDGESIGALVLRRVEVHPFTGTQIALLQTFADQAVIAIGNVRLFEELQERTRELSQSIDDLRTAQDRLIQTEKLASLGQLTAGIAHEIKNPLNFVNNFSALSSELTDELEQLLLQERLTDEGRTTVNELIGLMKDNLGKVVQHGNRADAIVKNMLLHSREGSSERRPVDINALVKESVKLAYHGARAEKTEFAITLQDDLDPQAGALELHPQEMTRALLNLISNGFYAATKRKFETADGIFEPVLTATTRNLGEAIEIRIRDNGTGIPPDVRLKIFNPFFTTKPAGEGTGLGLSITHDIVVKQHGGKIDVETSPGAFTEFIITLPRGSGASAKSEAG